MNSPLRLRRDPRPSLTILRTRAGTSNSGGSRLTGPVQLQTIFGLPYAVASSATSSCAAEEERLGKSCLRMIASNSLATSGCSRK